MINVRLIASQDLLSGQSVAAASHSLRPPLPPSCWGRGWLKAVLGRMTWVIASSASSGQPHTRMPMTTSHCHGESTPQHPWAVVPPTEHTWFFAFQQSPEHVCHCLTLQPVEAELLHSTQGLTPRPGPVGPELHSLSAPRGLTFSLSLFHPFPRSEG